MLSLDRLPRLPAAVETQPAILRTSVSVKRSYMIRACRNQPSLTRFVPARAELRLILYTFTHTLHTHQMVATIASTWQGDQRGRPFTPVIHRFTAIDIGLWCVTSRVIIIIIIIIISSLQ